MFWTRLIARGSFLSLTCLILVLTASRLHAQTSLPTCRPSPEIKTALDQLAAQTQTSTESNYQFWLSQQAALKTLLQSHPGDFFAQRAYVNGLMAPDPSTSAQGNPSEKGTLQVLAEYEALREQHPDDTVIQYLYATILIDRDTPTAKRLLEDILQRAPAFPWPHLDLVRVYVSPNFLDRGKAESHLSAFLEACPEDVSSYFWLRALSDDDMTHREIAQFRRIITSRVDLDAISQYPLLWALEFRSHPRSDYDVLRKQVASDLTRVHALPLQDHADWWWVLSDGYQHTGDTEKANWAQTQSDQHLLPDHTSPPPEVHQWFKDHPIPDENAAAETRQAYRREELKQGDQWIKKYPNSLAVWTERLNTIAALDDVSAADCVAALEQRLQLEQAAAGPMPLYWWTYFELADFASRKKIAPAREVELAHKGVETIEAEWENIPQRDLNSTADDLDYYPNFYWASMKARAFLFEAEGYVRLHQPGEAVKALNKANLRLQELDSDMQADESRRQLHGRGPLYQRHRVRYWQIMANVAQSQNRNTDAMAYYQSALLARFDSDIVLSPGDKDDLGDEARQLWVRLGGTEDGWNSWYGQRATALAGRPHLEWQTVSEPLPSFRLTDLQGHTWQLADLQGKVLFLNFWTMGCFFCREEMPRLQKLAALYKDQPDVVFLSLNLDDDSSLLDSFLKQNKWNLTVLPAYDYGTDVLKVLSIPQNWIVAPDGVVRLKGVGYDATEKWEQGMKEAIEKCKSRKAGAANSVTRDTIPAF